MKPVVALVLAIYLLLGSFFPRTDFSQLLKLANIADHYRIHESMARAKGDDFSKWQFLKTHFLEPDDHQHGQDSSHCQLPLHSVNHSFVLSHHQSTLPLLSRPLPQAGKEIFHYLFFAAVHFPDGIFHPPLES